MNSKITSEKGSSRRDFLKNAGIFTAGAIVAGGAMGVLSPRKAEAAVDLAWPYPAGGLNAQEVAEAGYLGYKGKFWPSKTDRPIYGAGAGGCAFGTAVALIEALAAQPDTETEKYSLTWGTINPALFTFGRGGIWSWGTLCGSANAAVALIYMVVPRANNASGKLIDEFMGWYCDFPFPTTRYDSGLINCEYKDQATSIAKSPLCHQSSGKWAHDNGFRIDSNERSTRCAKVTGDCAAKVVEMLNAWKAGTLVYQKTGPDFQDGVDSERCMTCHIIAPNDTAQSRMNCLGCHPDKICHNGEII